jgi:hypothetical protein
VLSAVAAVALSGCWGSDGDAEPATTSVGTTTSSGTTGTTGTETGSALPGASTRPVSGESAVSETVLLERVAVGRNDGFDRVVFQFRNGVPGYRVEYVQPPISEDGSGNRIEVEGNAFVIVRMEPASGFDLSVAEGELVYKGPRRLSGKDAGTSTIEEVVRNGDFEAVLSWAIGLDERVPFRVLVLDSPSRLVVDFDNG